MILNTLKNKTRLSKSFTVQTNLRSALVFGLIALFTGCGGDSNQVQNIPVVQEKNALPVFTSPIEFILDLGQTNVGVVSAMDADAADVLTFSISRGDDRELFTLTSQDSESVQLDFKEAPDNGSYEVVILARDGKIGVEHAITVIVGCGSPEPDPSIISDFECQQNHMLVSSSEPFEIMSVINPDIAGINPSPTAGVYTNPTSMDDNISVTFEEGIESVIDLAETGGFRIKVLTPSQATNSTLSVRLQGGLTPVEFDADLLANDLWTEYVFNFSDAGGDHTQLEMFFNKGRDDAEFTYHIDDMRFVSAVCGEPDLTIVSDFECNQNQTLPAEILTIDNPDKSGINLSAKVGEFTDLPDAWAATVIDFGTAIDLSSHNQLKFKLRAPVTGPFLGKLEGGTSEAKEIWTEINTVGEWVEYTFDFSDQANANHNKIAFFVNGGVENAGTDVYQIDDIRFDCLLDANIINDFDCQQNQPLPEGVVKVDNPDRTGVNKSAKVGELTDLPDPWAATVFDFGAPIDLSTHNQLVIKIRSSIAVPLLAKLEGGTSGVKEIFSSIDEIDSWVEYRFDFSDQATENHNKVAIFFNAGVENAGTDVYQIDDISFKMP